MLTTFFLKSLACDSPVIGVHTAYGKRFERTGVAG
jgi:hypothetical protein